MDIDKVEQPQGRVLISSLPFFVYVGSEVINELSKENSRMTDKIVYSNTLRELLNTYNLRGTDQLCTHLEQQ